MEVGNGLEATVEYVTNNFLAELKADCDLSAFERPEALLKKEKQLMKENIDDAKELIKKLQQDYSKIESEGASLGEDLFTEGSYEINKNKKEKTEIELKEELVNIEGNKSGCSKALSQLLEEFKALEEKKCQLDSKRDKFVPWKKDKFALYMSATGIHWNFGCKENEIRGYVTGKGDIKPFSINSDEHKSFYTANYLWDVVASAFDE